MYWNVTAARLAFIIVFEHVIFFIVYLMQWLVPDVPRFIQNKIDHERYIDQRERWASKATEDHLRDAACLTKSVTHMLQITGRTDDAFVDQTDGSAMRSRSRTKPLPIMFSTDNT